MDHGSFVKMRLVHLCFAVADLVDFCLGRFGGRSMASECRAFAHINHLQGL